MSLVEKALQKIQSQHVKPPDQAVARAVRANAGAVTSPAALANAASFQSSAPAIAFVPQGPRIEIDANALRTAGLLPTIEHERVLTRQLRAVKHGLLRKIAADPIAPETISRAVMVTSGLPGDGKTFTAINLAISLALEKDLKVLLVDADTPKPHITGMLGLSGQRGLLDVLTEPDSDAAAIVRSTSIRGLYFVPVGRNSDVATELLSSDRMISVVQRLAGLESNMLLLFDSPPMLLTSESQVLAALMNQILVVVKSGTTPRSVVKQTLELLSGGAGHVSLLLNDARRSDLSDYGYGYGYGEQSYPENPNANAGGTK